MGLRVLNADGKEVTPIMGSYGIGIERILSAAIELYHDKDGMILPRSIAPFDVVVTPANNADAAQMQAAREIYQACLTLGLDALLDDRDERPGVKFKDADLIGIPYRITVGKKLGGGQVTPLELLLLPSRQQGVQAIFHLGSSSLRQLALTDKGGWDRCIRAAASCHPPSD